MQKITSQGSVYIAISLMLVSMLHLACKSSRIQGNLSYEDQLLRHQNKQFDNPKYLNVKKCLLNFGKLNREVLINRDSDSFWIILVFDKKKLFEALYLSDRDTVIYSLKQDSVIQHRNNLEYIQMYAFLIDYVIKKKKMPFVLWSGIPTLYIASKINLKKRNIVQGGFNVHNYEIIERF